eukprot:m.320672 g.320672  ORF g.320672 m.320672 type:complete len:184 (+) comp20325_c0_seq2:150-701(+)
MGELMSTHITHPIVLVIVEVHQGCNTAASPTKALAVTENSCIVVGVVGAYNRCRTVTSPTGVFERMTPRIRNDKEAFAAQAHKYSGGTLFIENCDTSSKASPRRANARPLLVLTCMAIGPKLCVSANDATAKFDSLDTHDTFHPVHQLQSGAHCSEKQTTRSAIHDSYCKWIVQGVLYGYCKG